jgi:hypothetical protein
VEQQTQTVGRCLTDLLALEGALVEWLERSIVTLERAPALRATAARWHETALAQRDALRAHLDESGHGGAATSPRATAVLDGLLGSGAPLGDLPVSTLLWQLHSALHHVALGYGMVWVISHRAYSERREEPSFRVAERHQRGYVQAAHEAATLAAETVGWELCDRGELCRCLCATCSGVGTCICITGGRSLTIEALAETVVPLERGVSLWQPRAEAPGERAGLREGDVVTAIDGADLPDVWKMSAMMAPFAAGQPVRLRVERPGEASREVVVTH